MRTDTGKTNATQIYMCIYRESCLLMQHCLYQQKEHTHHWPVHIPPLPPHSTFAPRLRLNSSGSNLTSGQQFVICQRYMLNIISQHLLRQMAGLSYNICFPGCFSCSKGKCGVNTDVYFHQMLTCVVYSFLSVSLSARTALYCFNGDSTGKQNKDLFHTSGLFPCIVHACPYI